MVLTQEQIASVTLGVQRIGQEYGYISFHRYHKSQEHCYQENSPEFYQKALASAGVRMDFVTDSLSFGLEYVATAASSRRFCYFDVYVDQKPHAHMGQDPCTESHGRLEVNLPVGQKRVTVWFPCLFQIKVRNVCLDDGATLLPVKYDHTLLAIGDSITQGYDALYPSCTYPALLAQRLNLNVINQGIGGDVYHSFNLGEGVGFAPDFVTVALGTNDWCSRIKERFLSSVTEYYKRLACLYPTSKIAVITPLWRGDKQNTTSIGTFEDMVNAVCQAASVCPKVQFIRGEDMLEHKKSLFSPDLLHPNDLGFENLAAHLVPALRQAFDL